MKKVMSLLTVLCLLLMAFAGCTQTPAPSASTSAPAQASPAEAAPSEASPAETSQGADAPAASDLKLAIVTTVAGLGDEAWNDTNYAGVKAFADSSGIDLTLVEPAEMQDVQNAATQLGQQGYDLVFISENTSSEYMGEIADQFPDTHYVLPEGTIYDKENITSIVFDTGGVGFLCGAYSVLMNDYLGAGTTAGWVGGIRNPILMQTEYSTLAGAQYVGGDLNVVYVGSFTDIARGKEVALSMYNDGIAIVGAFAGGASSGVYQAAETFEDGKYAMGCATGQFTISPDRIIASNVKSIDTLNETICQEFAAGSLKSGQYDATVGNGGVSIRYSPINQVLNEKTPQTIKDQIEELKAKVVSGEIVPPITEEDYNTFKAEVLDKM